MGRPLKKIDEQQVYELAKIQCSYQEMAAVLDCDESTLTRRFSQVIKRGREDGKSSLKRKQYEVAMSGSVPMLIWLGKIVIGQREVIEQKNESLEQSSKVLEDLASKIQESLEKQK